MKIVRLPILLAGILTFAAAGVSTAQEASEAPEAAKERGVSVEYSDRVKEKLARQNLRIGEPQDRILQHLINGWNRLDNQHLVLTVRVSDKYLVRLNRYCRGLDHSEDIQFSSVGSDLTSMDQIKVRDSLGYDTCNITEIRRLEKIEEEESAQRPASGAPQESEE